MWCQLCLFQNGTDCNSMLLINHGKIRRYCRDVMKLWSLTVNNFQKDNDELEIKAN